LRKLERVDIVSLKTFSSRPGSRDRFEVCSMSIRSRAGAPWFRALAGLGLFALSSGSAEAIPAFARRYAVPCHFCHDGYPNLSVIGEQFKERGYRLENETTSASDWWKSIPVSVRASLRQTFEEEGDAQTAGLLRLVSAGNFGNRASYWIDETYSVDGDGFDRVGTDNAFLRVEVLPEELYVKGGRIELDLPFTQARSPQLFAYDVYFASTGFETDSIGAHQDGVEAGGFLDDTTRWSVAVVKGRNSDEQEALSSSVGGFEGNLFGRLVRRFGEGRGGAYLYWGRNTLARASPEPSAGPDVLEWDDHLFRLGLDGSLYLSSAHVYGTFLYGRNSNSFADVEHPGGTREGLSFTGGFGQVDYAVRDAIWITGRLDWVHGPPPGTAGPSRSYVAFTPGLKLWLSPRIRLVFELNFRNQDRPTRGALQIDLVL
jgi:hypothetical protein